MSQQYFQEPDCPETCKRNMEYVKDWSGLEKRDLMSLKSNCSLNLLKVF